MGQNGKANRDVHQVGRDRIEINNLPQYSSPVMFEFLIIILVIFCAVGILIAYTNPNLLKQVWIQLSTNKTEDKSVKNQVIPFKPPVSEDPDIHKSDRSILPFTLSKSVKPQKEPQTENNFLWMTIDCRKDSFLPDVRLLLSDYKNILIVNKYDTHAYLYFVDGTFVENFDNIASLKNSINETQKIIKMIEDSNKPNAQLFGKTIEQHKQILLKDREELATAKSQAQKRILTDKHYCIHRDGSRVYIPDWLIPERYRLRIKDDGEMIVEKIRLNNYLSNEDRLLNPIQNHQPSNNAADNLPQ